MKLFTDEEIEKFQFTSRPVINLCKDLSLWHLKMESRIVDFWNHFCSIFIDELFSQVPFPTEWLPDYIQFALDQV
jgi:hypothetical protein